MIYIDCKIQTPCYIVDESLLIKNLETLADLKKRTGCKILLAQKAFSMFYFYPMMSAYLDGTTASGLYEAKLADEYFKGENHVFSPAFKLSEIEEITNICSHIVFNSFSQYKKYGAVIKQAGKQCGIRINPEFSTQDHAIYDPCAEGSRLGITKDNLLKAIAYDKDLLKNIDGIHFHTLCEQNADSLIKTVEAVENRFGEYLRGLKWLNIGGGHHITKPGYDIDALAGCVDYLQNKYDLTVYIEPGEAVALNAGFLLAEIVDIVDNGIKTLILDASAAAHMPDVLEMPYRPEIIGAGCQNEKKYTYRLGGSTCLAGDIIGDYSFDREIKIGDRIIFTDMAHYTMVKNNTFNGMPLPGIVVKTTGGEYKTVKSFDYKDFKGRLS